MNIAFLGSLLSVTALTILTTTTSGGWIGGLLNYALLAIMLCCMVPGLLISGCMQDFGRALFWPAKKWKTAPLVLIQNAHQAVRLAIKMQLYLGAFLSLVSFVPLMYNWDIRQYAGPNMDSVLVSFLNALLIALVLYPVEGYLKHLLLTYMDETETKDMPAPIKQDTPIKTILLLLVLVVVLGLGFWLFWEGSLKNEKAIPTPLDIPTIALLMLFTANSLLWSLTIKDFGKALLAAVAVVQTPSSKIAMSDSIDLVCKTLLTAGGAMTLIAFLSILKNLTDASALVPNAYLGLLAILYATALAFLLLPLRGRIKKDSTMAG